MFCNSDDFVLDYFWKYVDYRINKTDIQNLKFVLQHDTQWNKLFTNYLHCFENDSDIHNYNSVCAMVDDNVFKRLMIYYTNVLKTIDHSVGFQKIRNKEQLICFIDNDIKFKILIVCIYYFF
jgi:hypothetical protein